MPSFTLACAWGLDRHGAPAAQVAGAEAPATFLPSAALFELFQALGQRCIAVLGIATARQHVMGGAIEGLRDTVVAGAGVAGRTDRTIGEGLLVVFQEWNFFQHLRIAI